MQDLAGKTAFVTGAASGIGLGIATALAQGGVKVMMCDIEQGALDKAVAGLRVTTADVAGVKVQWGGADVGAWTDGVPSSFHDWGHFQLDPSEYPA